MDLRYIAPEWRALNSRLLLFFSGRKHKWKQKSSESKKKYVEEKKAVTSWCYVMHVSLVSCSRCVETNRSTLYCNTLQHTATHCNTLQHRQLLLGVTPRQLLLDACEFGLHHIQDVLWQIGVRYAATHCNTLPHTATHWNALQHTATHCNTLQHTATHCNTLQRHARHVWHESFISCVVYTTNASFIIFHHLSWVV